MTNINSLLTNITKNKDFELKPVIEKNIVTSNSGNSSQEGITVDENNTIVGFEAGQDIVNGFSNTIIGKDSGLNLVSGIKNVLIGEGTGSELETGSENVFVGYEAGTSVTTGISNTLVGFQAGSSITEGNNNSLFGYSSGSKITIGGSNSLFGNNSGLNIIDGESNSCFGMNSGYNLTSGYSNSFYGFLSGFNSNTGTNNCFYGLLSGYSVSGNSNNNSLYGFRSGEKLTSTSSNNSFFGYQTGPSTDSLINNSTAIGYDSKANHSNTIVIGSQAQSGNSNSFYLPSGSFFTRQSGYGTNTLTDFNSYDCQLKYNSTTGQVILKENDSNKPLKQNIIFNTTSVTLTLINGMNYYIPTIPTFQPDDTLFTINLPDPISLGVDGIKIRITLSGDANTKYRILIKSVNALHRFVGDLRSINNSNGPSGFINTLNFCVGVSFPRADTTFFGSAFKTGSYYDFTFVTDIWYFKSVMLNTAISSTSMSTNRNFVLPNGNGFFSI